MEREEEKRRSGGERKDREEKIRLLVKFFLKWWRRKMRQIRLLGRPLRDPHAKIIFLCGPLKGPYAK